MGIWRRLEKLDQLGPPKNLKQKRLVMNTKPSMAGMVEQALSNPEILGLSPPKSYSNRLEYIRDIYPYIRG